MQMYKPGAQFLLHGQIVTVDFVMLRRGQLQVYLKEHRKACDTSELRPLPRTAEARRGTAPVPQP